MMTESVSSSLIVQKYRKHTSGGVSIVANLTSLPSHANGLMVSAKTPSLSLGVLPATGYENVSLVDQLGVNDR